MIVTVTLNAAIDRTLVVPNFQPGQRHRASVGFPSAGGKGINVARALKRLGAPVVCTGLAGGRTGTLLVEELTNEGILNDFVRIHGESRTSIAVLDPTSNAYTEINEWGPEVDRGGARHPAREARLPRPAAPSSSCSPGRCRAAVDPGFYGELVRELSRGQLLAVVDSEGEPLRLGRRGRAVPRLAEPPGGGGARRPRVRRRGGSRRRARRDRRPRRAQRPHHARARLLRAASRGPGRAAACARRRRAIEPVSGVGAGDTLLAGFLAARVERAALRGGGAGRRRRRRRVGARGGRRPLRPARGEPPRVARPARAARARAAGGLGGPQRNLVRPS